MKEKCLKEINKNKTKKEIRKKKELREKNE